MIGSKRAKRIAKVVGDVGCDGNPKGIIRYDNLGSLEYWNPKSVRWGKELKAFVSGSGR